MEASDSSDVSQSQVFSRAHYDRASWASAKQGSHIGNITEHSFQSTFTSANHDWALIELHPNQLFSNFVDISYPPEPDQEHHSTTLTFKPLVSTPIQSSVNIIIPTSRGNQRGTLTSSTSSLLVAPGCEFVETHDVVLEDGFCKISTPHLPNLQESYSELKDISFATGRFGVLGHPRDNGRSVWPCRIHGHVWGGLCHAV